MKPGIPWSVKGIEAEAREAAKFAARRSGMTLGEWLNSMILEQVEGGDDLDRRYGRRRPAIPARHGYGGADDLRSRLDALADQLSSLNLRDQDTATGRYLARSIQDPEADPALKSVMRRLENNEIQFTEAIHKVSDRLDDLAGRAAHERAAADPRVDELVTRMEANEQHTCHAIDRMGAELGNLARQVSELPAAGSFDKPEDVPGYSSLETALRNVVDHIEVSDKRTRETLKGLQERIAATHKAAEAGRSAPVPDQTAALDRLERQLSQLAERMQSQETRGLKAVKDMVDEKFTRLSEQVSTASHSADTLVQKAETAAGRLAERQVREAEQRLKSMIAEATAKAARGADGPELARLRTDIEGLGRRLEALQTEAASERDVRSLKAALEEVSSTVARGPDLTPFTEFEQRITALSSELSARSGQGEMDTHLMALAERLDELDGAVRAMAEPVAGDDAALAGLRQHIAAVDERLSATERQLGHLQTIEKSIAQLFEAVEHSKSSTEEIAEATARRVVDQMAAREGTPGGASAETSAAIQALEQGLSAVKASAETADRRNQETLEAVHETLEQIITKLGELESWHSASAAATARREADERPHGDDPAGALSWNALMPDLAGDEGPAADTGQNPADDDGFMPTLPSPGETGAEGDQGLADHPAEPVFTLDEADEASPPVREDYIAAARRAAQTAAPRSGLAAVGAFSLFARNKVPAAHSVATDPAAGVPGKSRLSLAFLKARGKTASNGQAAPGPAAGALATPGDAAARRKRLILVGAVLLAAAAAYSLNVQRQVSAPAGDPPRMGDLSPLPAPATGDPLVSGALSANADGPVKAARTDILDNALVRHTGMAPAEALAPEPAPEPTSSDVITTASLAPQSTTRKDDVATRLSALAAPVGQDKAAAAVGADPDALPAAIGSPALRQAAASGIANAQFVVASRYLEGKGIDRDAVAAARWYQKAAAQGLASAQYRLATLFERGTGVPQDLVAARNWYTSAAEAGNVKAMHNLAVLHADDSRGTADYARAVRWFGAAAGYGLKDSQFNLAVLNERGLGTAVDRKAAFRLYSLAARQGDKDAAARVQALRPYLGGAELASVESEVAAWLPRKIDRTVNFVTIEDAAWNVEAGNQAAALPPSPDLTGSRLISRAQELLGGLGYDVGSRDGVMGSRTANAVRLFQMQNGLAVTGMVSNELLRHLMSRTG